jgi:hypothetical protein
MLPLDGGQILVALESHVWKRKDQIFSHAISLLVAVAIACLAISRGLLWITILGVWFAFTNGHFLWQKLQGYRDRSLRRDLEEARAQIDREQCSCRHLEQAREEIDREKDSRRNPEQAHEEIDVSTGSDSDRVSIVA